MATPRRADTSATSACEPSPPAMPITSAPPVTARSASSTRSSPGPNSTASMPRARHASASRNLAAFPPPLRGLMIRTPRVAGGTGSPGVAARLSLPVSTPAATATSVTAAASSPTRTRTGPKPWEGSGPKDTSRYPTAAAVPTRTATTRYPPRRVTANQAPTTAIASRASSTGIRRTSPTSANTATAPTTTTPATTANAANRCRTAIPPALIAVDADEGPGDPLDGVPTPIRRPRRGWHRPSRRR